VTEWYTGHEVLNLPTKMQCLQHTGKVFLANVAKTTAVCYSLLV